MSKLIPVLLLVVPLGLGGCAISGGADISRSPSSSTAVNQASLPPLPNLPEETVVPQAGTEKFSKSDQEMLVVEASASEDLSSQADSQHAYASAPIEQPSIDTQKASLKPFVGRWTLKPSNTQDKVQQLGSYLGLSERCEVVLEDVSAGYGYKASGSSACPTSLFMLDSWVAFENRLILRDHMGDEIVKLTSRGTNVWIGVNKHGDTLILNKT